MISRAVGPPEVISAVTRRGRQLYGQRHLTDPAAPLAVLLHDRGADLDSLRWLRDALVRQGISVDEWDLPGHGLSEGDYDIDCGEAIEAIGTVGDPNGERGISYVGVGSTCGYLLEAPLPEPVSLTLIQPPAPSMAQGPRGIRDRTATLCLVDPTDNTANDTAAELSKRARAWFVRAFVHGYVASPTTGQWQLHAESMTSRLILEQSWLWRRRRQPARREPAPPDHGSQQTSDGGPG